MGMIPDFVVEKPCNLSTFGKSILKFQKTKYS